MEDDILYQQLLQKLTQNNQIISFTNNEHIYYGNIKDLKLPLYPIKINCCIIFLCSKGSASFEINEHIYTINERSLAINLPENAFRIKSTSIDFDGFYIITTASFIFRYLKIRQCVNSYIYVHHTINIPLNEKEYNLYFEYISILLKIINLENDSHKIGIIDAMFLSFATYILSILEDHLKQTESPIPQKHQEYVFSKFIELLSENYKEEHSVQFYADKLNISSKHLSKLLKGYTQKTASDWITNYIIQEAKMQLKYSESSIQEIAYKLNFPSQTFFGKYFKKYTNSTPGKFRSDFIGE